jgi:hypothetical protein
MFDVLASIASWIKNAAAAVLQAVLRPFAQPQGPPAQSTTAGRAAPGRIVIKSAHDSSDDVPSTPWEEPAPAPPSDGTLTGGRQSAPPAPEPEMPISPAPDGPRRRGGGAGGVARMREEPEVVASAVQESAASAEAAAGAEPQEAASGSQDKGAAAAPEPEPVLLGGSAPRRARPGDVILAQFAAYVARFEDQARKALQREAAPGEVRLGEETDCRWAVGTRVTVRCTARGLTVAEPVQSFVWDGDCRTASFDVEVPADARPHRAVILMEAFVHDREDAPDAVPVGRLRMSLEIGDQADDGAPVHVDAAADRTAFASYASEDRLDVLERVSSIERSAGLEVFMDVIDLRMGDQWEPKLRSRIAASDRFLLFWSEHAAGKKWVTWEWEQALAAKGEDALELHLLRSTPIELIPEPLRKYHFNDVYLLAYDAELYRREQAARAAAANAPGAGG